MATTLQLDIVTPERRVFSGTVQQVILPAWEGQMGVLPDHDPLLALLRGGRTIVQTANTELQFVTGRGFAEIGMSQVTLLTDSCEAVPEIDPAQAREQVAAAEAELSETNGWSEQARNLEARLEVLRARVSG